MAPFDFKPVYALINDLRGRGEAQALQGLLQALHHMPEQGFDQVQLGIEMNNAGLWHQAEELLTSGLQAQEIQGYNRMVTHTELAIALFSMGYYEQAREQMMLGRADLHHALAGMLGADSPDLEVVKQKFWQGQALHGESILLMVEGGAGDLFMHSRYFNALLADGAGHIYLEVGDHLRPMIPQHPKIEPVSSTQYRQTADWVSTTFELFYQYQRHPHVLPAQAAYPVFSDPHSLPFEAQHLIDQAHGFKVGLITTSTSMVRHDPFRSMPESDIQPLLDWGRGQALTWFNLNRGGPTALSADTQGTYGIRDLGPYINSFADTAEMLRQLDLLISIDTGPAHLAASLGRPTWMLLSANCDCRWMEHAHLTPWYPSMRLFRQLKLGDWGLPLARVMSLLSPMVSHRSDSG